LKRAYWVYVASKSLSTNAYNAPIHACPSACAILMSFDFHHNLVHEPSVQTNTVSLRDQGACGGTLVSPGWWKSTDGLVIAGQTMDTRLDENEAELGVLVLAIALEMLADGDGLLDQHVQVLWNFWCEA